MIHWELCKEFRFDHTNNLFMHEPESVLEKETHKLHWDIQIERDHLISARRLDIVVVHKKKETVPADHWETLKEGEKKNKYLDLAKLWDMKVMVISVVIGALGIVTK